MARRSASSDRGRAGSPPPSPAHTMTKPFDTHRDEIVRLYIDDNKTLEVVMDLMRTRHRFTASRRSYMDNLKKWGVRKYKRKVVVHNAPPGVDDSRPHHSPPRDTYTASSSSSQNMQTLVLPYHVGHAMPAHHQPLSPEPEPTAPYAWACFASGWLPEHASVPDYAVHYLHEAPQYLTSHPYPPGGSIDQHGPTPSDGSGPPREPSRRQEHHNRSC